MTEILLALSLALNVVFGLLFLWVLRRKGGLPYARTKLTELIGRKEQPAAPGHYDHRQSLFSLMTPTQRDIIFLGDSITEECDWGELFQNQRVKNRGIGGDTTEGVLRRLGQIENAHPQQIFLMVGINDLGAGVPVETVVNAYRAILSTLRRTAPGTEVFVQSVLPMNTTWKPVSQVRSINAQVLGLNALLRLLAAEFHCRYIDLHSSFVRDDQLDTRYTYDGLHLNGEGYLLWKSLVKDLIAGT